MSEPDRQVVLDVVDLRKSYNVGRPTETEVLHGVNLKLGRDDFAALVAPRGPGKARS